MAREATRLRGRRGRRSRGGGHRAGDDSDCRGRYRCTRTASIRSPRGFSIRANDAEPAPRSSSRLGAGHPARPRPHARVPVTPAGWTVTPAGKQVRIARRRRGLPGPARLGAVARRARSCCRSRAARRASTPPTCSTCAAARAAARSAATTPAAARRGGLLRRHVLARRAARVGVRAAARTSSTPTRSARRCARPATDPGAELPRRARLRPHAARRPHLRRQQPLGPRGHDHQPARPHGHGDRPGDQRRHGGDRPRRRAPALRRRVRAHAAARPT